MRRMLPLPSVITPVVVIVPVVLMRLGLPAAMLSAVLIGTAWFVLMLRTSEMPGHH